MSSATTKRAASKSAVKPKTSPKTTSKSKTTAASAKPTAPPTAKPKAAVPPKVVEGPQPVVLGAQMRKKELVDTIVSQTGMKKKDVKPVVEATLGVLGQALADNRELNLQPFGRLKVRRERVLPNGRVVIAKVRQTTPDKGAETDPIKKNDE